jgi:hypothetical protein
MCIICDPAFAGAFRGLMGQSRRQFLRVAAAAAAGPFIAEPVGPALADGSVNEALESGLETSAATIFVARKIITMERDNPTATAVAVAGDKILVAGSLDEVKATLGDRPRLAQIRPPSPAGSPERINLTPPPAALPCAGPRRWAGARAETADRPKT